MKNCFNGMRIQILKENKRQAYSVIYTLSKEQFNPLKCFYYPKAYVCIQYIYSHTQIHEQL